MFLGNFCLLFIDACRHLCHAIAFQFGWCLDFDWAPLILLFFSHSVPELLLWLDYCPLTVPYFTSEYFMPRISRLQGVQFTWLQNKIMITPPQLRYEMFGLICCLWFFIKFGALYSQTSSLWSQLSKGHWFIRHVVCSETNLNLLSCCF